ncbi:cytochrome c oxidase assembly factor CtaG [Halalkalibacter sp. APA_J-10(15)]|uniref:cytochrome c oxidase assembly factor CtaG n=1 Tax=unclassified Halalkalibacter TaxID=2893063 RepID=UPI001FF16A9B|nr:cytochrome c oxidase assembly factor CtaG [Halalkalibacter sp. APA_J-10(15)]MCK0472667.1 cytochrome c oxidase assembly factor CtaG [Halalkalibacter sp. APA_J-10(15)]
MSLLFDTFGFRALWTPELIILLAIVGLLYMLLVTKWLGRFAGAKPVRVRQKVYFFLGLFALYLGWGSPLYITGHLMISFHMLQMVFAYFIATPLFLLGLPKWFLEAIIRKASNPFTVRIFRVIWSPIIALFLFNGLFSFYHVPLMFDSLMQAPVLHSVYEYALLFASFLMWWHMLAPLPVLTQLPHLKRIGYIFGNGLLITPACALIIFAGSAMYSTYTDPLVWANVMAYCLPNGVSVPTEIFAGPTSFSFLEARTDQQLAGVMMKVFQEIVYGIAIGFAFKQWLVKEKQQDGKLTISDAPTVRP